MGIWFYAYNSAIFCSMCIKIHIRVPKTTCYNKSNRNLGFRHVGVIWRYWTNNYPNMAALRGTAGGWGRPQKFGVLVCRSTAILKISFTKIWGEPP